MENRSLYISLILFVMLFFIQACAADSEDQRVLLERENHDRMVAMLDSIITDARHDPLKYFYANEFRLTWLDSLRAANPDVPQLEYRYAMELQNSTELQRSIPMLQELGKLMTDTRSQQLVNEGLAIGFLRLAELNNCIENYTPSNCILPFDEEAVHRNKEYIRSSIGHLELLLSDYSGNYEYVWMYNIAHIANGSYPESVNPDFLIPGLQSRETLPEGLQAPVFRDRGMDSGVADNRISGSSCVEDFTGNGHLDIFATSYGFGDRVVFYEGTGNGDFENKTFSAGLEGIMGGLNIECADINNSGFADVLVLRGAWLADHGEHPNSLLRNNGDGTFTDITISSGLLESKPTQVASFADLNGNGHLDLFIGNESVSAWQAVFSGDEGGGSQKRYPSAIFLNNGDETFTRHEILNGFELDDFVKGAAWGDFNNDGLPDLYVSVLGGANKLFMHRGFDSSGTPQFEEIAEQAGVQGPEFSFPVMVFDFNNNGLDDILAVTYDVRAIGLVADEVAREKLGLQTQSEFSRLYLNRGDETFLDISEQAGLQTVMFGMGANVADLNNNGYPDIYIGTGAPDLSSIIPNRLFINQNGERFVEATAAGRVGQLQKGHGVSMADFNSNGMIDIYTVLGGAVEGDFYHNALFENRTEPGNWLMVELEGRSSNRQGIGARLTASVTNGEVSRKIYRRASTGGSFGANNSRVHFGMHTDETVERVEIQWPGSGTIQTIENPDMNRMIRIIQHD
jgi:hypothetical protein